MECWLNGKWGMSSRAYFSLEHVNRVITDLRSTSDVLYIFCNLPFLPGYRGCLAPTERHSLARLKL